LLERFFLRRGLRCCRNRGKIEGLSSRAEERLGRKPSKGLSGARGSPVLGLERTQVAGVLKE